MIRLDEPKTVEIMIRLYCKKNHSPDRGLCRNCTSLLTYSLAKLRACPLLPDKPVCSKCKVHCYKPEQRELIRRVMRFSGPRMILHHPVIGLKYLIRKALNK